MAYSIKETAEYVIRKLLKEGFKIQRYDSFSTNSIYIKLDYGIGNSIRISDHKGKKHLQYRYNLLSNYSGMEKQKSPEGWDRYYYHLGNARKMIKDIIREKETKIKRYGEVQYKKYMDSNYTDNKHNQGFWSQCKEIFEFDFLS